MVAYRNQGREYSPRIEYLSLYGPPNPAPRVETQELGLRSFFAFCGLREIRGVFKGANKQALK